MIILKDIYFGKLTFCSTMHCWICFLDNFIESYKTECVLFFSPPFLFFNSSFPLCSFSFTLPTLPFL